MKANIVVFTISFVLSLLLAEAGLRLLAHSGMRVAAAVPLAIPNREVGQVYPRNMDIERYDPELKHYVNISTNSHGYRDDEWDIQSLRDKKKIMVVGDSFTAAFEVEAENRYTDLLEMLLNAKERQYEVLNFGRSGSGPESYKLVLEKWYPIINPDIVVFAIYNGNDFLNQSYTTEPGSGRVNYIVQENDVIPYQSIAPLKQRLIWEVKLVLGKSYVAQLVKKTMSGARNDQNLFGHAQLGIDDSLLYCNDKIDIKHTRLIFSKILSDVQNLVGNKLIILQIPERDQEILHCEYLDPEKLVSEVATEKNIPVLQLIDAMKTGSRQYYVGHFNYEGHRFTAGALYDFLIQNSFVKQ